MREHGETVWEGEVKLVKNETEKSDILLPTAHVLKLHLIINSCPSRGGVQWERDALELGHMQSTRICQINIFVNILSTQIFLAFSYLKDMGNKQLAARTMVCI